MEDQNMELEVQDCSACLEDGEPDKSKLGWILEAGLNLGKQFVITGVVVSSAPVVLPPLMVVSALGFACSVPFGFVFACYACTEKLMSKLLPSTSQMIDYEEVWPNGEDEATFSTEKEEKGEYEDMDDWIEMKIDLADNKDDTCLKYGQSQQEKFSSMGQLIVGDSLEGKDEECIYESVDVLDKYEFKKVLSKESKQNEDEKQFLDITSPEIIVTRDAMPMEVSALGARNEEDKKTEELDTVSMEQSGTLSMGPNVKNVNFVDDEGKRNANGRNEIQRDVEDKNTKFDKVVAGMKVMEDSDVGVRNKENKKTEKQFAGSMEHSSIQGSLDVDVKNVVFVENESKTVSDRKETQLDIADKNRKVDNIVAEIKGRIDSVVEATNKDDKKTEVQDTGNMEQSGIQGSWRMNVINVDFVEEEGNGEKEIQGDVKDKNTKVAEVVAGVKGTEDRKRQTNTKGKGGSDRRGKKKTLKTLSGERKGAEEDKGHEKFSGKKKVSHEETKTSGKNNLQLGQVVNEKSVVRNELSPEFLAEGKNKDEMHKSSSGKQQDGQLESILIKNDDVVLSGSSTSVVDQSVVPSSGNDLDNPAGSAIKIEKPVGIEEKEGEYNGKSDEVVTLTVLPELKNYGGIPELKINNSSQEEFLCDEKIWEQMEAIRVIVGFKNPRRASYFEELKALYLFTGIEPPSLFTESPNLAEFYGKLRFLMSVIGVK